MANFKVVIKCHWSKGKGFQKHIDVPSDDETSENEGQNNSLEDIAMDDEETTIA